MVFLYNGVLRSRNEGPPTLHNYMNGTGRHYANSSKPGGEKQIPYDLTYKWNLIIKQPSKQNITTNTEIKNKVILIRVEG